MPDYDEHERMCVHCGTVGCDGLKNCDKCGEDTDCKSELCINCQKQADIDSDEIYDYWAPDPFDQRITHAYTNPVRISDVTMVPDNLCMGRVLLKSYKNALQKTPF